MRHWCVCVVSSPDEFPQSLVISSQVANQGGDGAVDPVLEENPVIINFVFELVRHICINMSRVEAHLSEPQNTQFQCL